MLVPFSYNLRSLFVRRSATLLTVLGIGATVAIVAGVIALEQGFQSMFNAGGRADLAVFLRPGATNEGDSQFSRDRGLKLIKSVPEIETGVHGPIAAMEAYLAVLLEPVRGGVTNVPLRGVQPMTFEMRTLWTCAGSLTGPVAKHREVVSAYPGPCSVCKEALRPRSELPIVAGRNFVPGNDEVIVGRRLVGRIANCNIGDVITLNKTPFRVVGTFDNDGQFGGEIWGDLDRLLAAMNRYGPNRVIAQLKPGTNLGSVDPAKALFTDDPPEPEPGTLAARILKDPEVPAKVYTEKEFLASQTVMMSGMLLFLAVALGLIMGLAAVFTATNTMLSALAARTHEIGVLLAMGYRPFPVFLSFMFEALVLGLIGGFVGSLMALPFNGVKAGTMNFQTFTEMAFAFQVTPLVLGVAISISLMIGMFGGAWPAWRAARLKPTIALRQG
jgi:putative ABC transport system permease protein